MRTATATLAATIAALTLVACAPAATDTGSDAGEVHTVRYEVTGTATAADLTLEGESGTVQQTGRAVPAAYERTAVAGQFLYLSAQNKGSGEITCTIIVDDKPVKSSTSTGEYAICQADGTL
jgi:hypothetical protein